ncbi:MULTISPECIES: LysR family transcriptional regulator [Leclercia]|uniref:LysR family transcriptional regulator n=1 Tax=Leclercia barmai TaxID=2785629 RepID=A0ABS7RZI8_9ENTR|nr:MULTISPECIES: LysR family transcriptional regulator [Leclercia]MBZ0059729.1 LysR family transcriptional regulator [Leclercia sp. EMC7]MCM5695121.1 LysR family transcriptional regulator [Leclercia sp. LTM01]MCM5699529.1 LysR family transcriptional regulator [Leclercia sp. LTM14]
MDKTMRFDLVSLSLFVAVAEEQNLTHAARRKHTAVSAVSKRIAELEQQVGTPLMLRMPRGITLTPAGHSLLYHARQVFRNLEKMEEELSDYAAGIRGHIRIYTISAALMNNLPRVVSDYLAHYPQTDIEIEEHTGISVVQGLLSGEADVGFFSSWTSAAGIVSWPWQHDLLSVLVWPTHPLAGRSELKFEDIIDEKLIGAHRNSAVSHILERQARACGKTLSVGLRVSSFISMAELVAQQLGIAIVPVNEVASSTLHSGVRLIPLAEPWAQRELLVGVKDYAQASPSVKSLIGSLIPCEPAEE